jgi:hypothetical protein
LRRRSQEGGTGTALFAVILRTTASIAEQDNRIVIHDMHYTKNRSSINTATFDWRQAMPSQPYGKRIWRASSGMDGIAEDKEDNFHCRGWGAILHQKSRAASPAAPPRFSAIGQAG